MGTREKYRSPKRFGYVGSASDFERHAGGDGMGVVGQRSSGSWVPGTGSRIPVPLRVLESDLEVSQGKTVSQQCSQRVGEEGHAPVHTSSEGDCRSSQGEGGSESSAEEALWANLDQWAGSGGRREEDRETSEERELHWLADRSGGEELAEELVTILEESSEEWEEEEGEEEEEEEDVEEVIVEVIRTARVIEVIEGSEEDEEEVVEGQEAVTIEVEDLEDVPVIGGSEESEETTAKEMDEMGVSQYGGGFKDIASEVRLREGLVSSSDGREGLVQALPAVIVEDFGGSSEKNFGEGKRPVVGQFCQGEYENLAPANQYYEQV